MQFNSSNELCVKEVIFYNTEAENGGAIYFNVNSSIHVERCIFEGCRATHATDGRGGAIYNNMAKITANSCCVSNCSAFFCADIMISSYYYVNVVSSSTSNCHAHYHSFYIYSSTGSKTSNINISNTYIQGNDNNHYASGLNQNVLKDSHSDSYTIYNSSGKAMAISIDDTNKGQYEFSLFNIIYNKVPTFFGIISWKNDKSNNNCIFDTFMFYGNEFNSFVYMDVAENTVIFKNCLFDVDLSNIGPYNITECSQITSYDVQINFNIKCFYYNMMCFTINNKYWRKKNLSLPFFLSHFLFLK